MFNNQRLKDTRLKILRFGPVPTFSLPEATFRRGAAVGLPNGRRQACRAARVKPLKKDQLAYDSALEKFLRDNGMLDRTPLFYYLMREAEVLGRSAPGKRPGTRLGPLGSRIVAEVILGVLNADPDSYVHADWEPPELTASVRIDSLKNMMFYATGYKGNSIADIN